MMDLSNYLREGCNLSVTQYCSSEAMALSVHTHISVLLLAHSPVTRLSNKSIFPLRDVLHPSHRPPVSIRMDFLIVTHYTLDFALLFWKFYSRTAYHIYYIKCTYLTTRIGSPFCTSPNTTGISDPAKRQRLFIFSSVHKSPSF